jgi:hypothetical protein
VPSTSTASEVNDIFGHAIGDVLREVAAPRGRGRNEHRAAAATNSA